MKLVIIIISVCNNNLCYFISYLLGLLASMTILASFMSSIFLAWMIWLYMLYVSLCKKYWMIFMVFATVGSNWKPAISPFVVCPTVWWKLDDDDNDGSLCWYIVRISYHMNHSFRIKNVRYLNWFAICSQRYL